MTYTQLILLLAVIKHSNSEDTRSILLSITNNVRYQCNQAGCSPSNVISVSSLRRCQIVCLTDSQCRTVAFNLITNQCETFPDIPSQYGSLTAQLSFLTMTATDQRRLSARE